MPLPWVRLDSNINSHPKTLDLLSRKDGHRAFTLFVCALGYAGGHGTDGQIPFAALPMLHGTRKLGDLLVEVGLWEPTQAGWAIHNYAQRQQLEIVALAKQESRRLGAAKANCARWHGPDCWKPPAGCSKESA